MNMLIDDGHGNKRLNKVADEMQKRSSEVKDEGSGVPLT